MAFSISQIFGGTKAPQQLSPQQAANPVLQQANQPSTPGNIPVVNGMPANPANPTVPLTAPAAEPTGLDKFNSMWEAPKPEDMPKAPAAAFAGVTPEAIKGIAGKTDFSKVVTPEMLAKISAGGDDAVAATMQAMNSMTQEVYAANATATMQMIEHALERQNEQFQARLPSLIKNQNVSDNLRSKNPIFNHPAAAPMLKSLQEQLALKNPNASAHEIQAQAEQFLESFASAATPTKVDTAVDKKGNSKDDWGDFLKM